MLRFLNEEYLPDVVQHGSSDEPPSQKVGGCFYLPFTYGRTDKK
jgi:hypothetical protein